MKFSLFAVALTGAVSLFSGIFAHPHPSTVSLPVRRAHQVSANSTGTMAATDFIYTVKAHLDSTHNELVSLRGKPNAPDQTRDAISGLTQFFSGFTARFKTNRSISLSGITTEVVPIILTAVRQVVSIIVMVLDEHLKEAPGVLHLVGGLLRSIGSLVFILGDVVGSHIPVFSWAIVPAVHVMGAFILAISDGMSPMKGSDSWFSKSAIFSQLSGELLSRL